MRVTDFEKSMLALLIWREARGQPIEGMIAVGCTVKNRVENPAWWGKDYMTVMRAKWQYSAMAAPGDPQLIKYPAANDPELGKALLIADGIVDGLLHHPMPGADSYFASYIKPPDWATSDKYVGLIGDHHFYNIDQDNEGSV